MSKYHNIPTGGFDSKKEAARFYELQLLQRAGKITDLKRQVTFVLIPTQYREDGKVLERAVKYIADFVYTQDRKVVVEDVKSEITRKNPEYIIKRKLMLYRYGIQIREV